MNELTETVPEMDLQPGELCVVRRPVVLRTILGSCVGVTLWSLRLGAGAMCHGVLPRCPPALEATPNVAEACRYVDFSIRYLARQFDDLGARRDELEVKVFGGADVLPVGEARLGKATVGMQNCRVAAEVLTSEGLNVKAFDLGGRRGRRICFHTGTGEVWLYRLAVWSPAKGFAT